MPFNVRHLALIGLDTNILARYYIQDEADTEAEKQHKSARKLLESGEPLMVCKTVLLEFEWVMRGYYKFTSSDVGAVFQHLLSLENISLEDRASKQKAIANFERRTKQHVGQCKKTRPAP